MTTFNDIPITSTRNEAYVFDLNHSLLRNPLYPFPIHMFSFFFFFSQYNILAFFFFSLRPTHPLSLHTTAYTYNTRWYIPSINSFFRNHPDDVISIELLIIALLNCVIDDAVECEWYMMQE